MNETQRDDAIDQMREIATLKELNGELLEACKALIYAFDYDRDAMPAMIGEAQEAIAKAEAKP